MTTDLFFFFGLEAEAAGAVTDEVVGVVASIVAGVIADVVAGAVFSDVYAVTGAAVVFTIYRPPTLVPEIEIQPGDDIINAPLPNVVRAPARSSRLMWRRETQNVGV